MKSGIERVGTCFAPSPSLARMVAPISFIAIAGPFEIKNRSPAAPEAFIARMCAEATSRTSTIGKYRLGKPGIFPSRIIAMSWFERRYRRP